MTGKAGWATGLALAAVIFAFLVGWAVWKGPAEAEPLASLQDVIVPSVGAGDGDVAEYVVEMEGLRFRPSRLEVPVGSVVTFVNRDAVTHNVVQTTPSQLGRDQAGFASPRLEQGESWSIRFDTPGRYPILCLDGGHYAVGMLGTIFVVPEADEGG